MVLVGGGAFVGWRMVNNKVNNSIPKADLFGDSGANGSPTASPTPPPGADIKGPLNILISGVDTRVSVPGWIPRSDSVLILHVNADLSSGYLTSLPRDLVVNVPAFAPAQFGGERTKLTHAMMYGSKVPGKSEPSTAQGFQLLSKTVSKYTGISRFDAGAVLTFGGLAGLVNAVGGVDAYVDQQTVSIHMQPNGQHRPECGGCEHGYSGPRMTYKVGMHHFTGWQAIDYSRQRYLSGGDYTRQRHQRQIIKAIVAKIFSSDTVNNPTQINKVIKALGKTLTFDGRGRTPTEFAYALRNLRPEKVTLVGLPGAGAYSGGSYIGENLTGVQTSYFAALRADTLDAFVASHPKLVNADPR